jgi:hypothetical protein
MLDLLGFWEIVGSGQGTSACEVLCFRARGWRSNVSPALGTFQPSSCIYVRHHNM